MTKQICRNCHFFSKRHVGKDGVARELWVDRNERDMIKNSDRSFLGNTVNLTCYLNVWSDGMSPSLEKSFEHLNSFNRKNMCFFFPFTENLSFPTAEKLQERAQQNSELKKSHSYTIRALWIAVVALIVDVVFRIIN